MPIYGSGGFTSYSNDRLARAARRLGRARRLPLRQDEDRHAIRTTISARVEAARDAIGDAALFVDANGAYSRKQALHFARTVRRTRRQLVRGAGVERRSRRLAAACATARRPAWTSPPENTATSRSISAACWRPARSTCCRPTRRAAAAITGFLRAAALADAFGLPLSAHCAPALHLPVCCAAPRLRHIEWFHDHVRIEQHAVRRRARAAGRHDRAAI